MAGDQMTDVKIGVIEQRLNNLEHQLGRMADSMQTLAEDMHKIATFEFRVGALERDITKQAETNRRLFERIEALERVNTAHNVKLGFGERLFWILVVIALGTLHIFGKGPT